ADCPGHATWNVPDEWAGDADADFPLHLLGKQPTNKLHSQLDPGAWSKAAKVNGREAVEISPRDAAARGIADGDIVEVRNGRGACLCGAVVTPDLMPGVVMISTGAWYDPEEPVRVAAADMATQMCSRRISERLRYRRGRRRIAALSKSRG
ncbi:MAG: molybdopterin dinucleotide binding domain-containing protein, partial [Pseudomonadota bacterium]|nr:molybdopterin dinucleotide binding domain-containing protein [Pseudomonadota bacterium]